MSTLDSVLKRLRSQSKVYENEQHNIDDEDDGGVIDVSLACGLADSIPYLIKTIENQLNEIESLKIKNKASDELVNNLDIKDDKSLWEKRNVEGVGNVLLVEESYYEGIAEMIRREKEKAYYDGYKQGRFDEKANWFYSDGDVSEQKHSFTLSNRTVKRSSI
jgi:hypothetical protein